MPITFIEIYGKFHGQRSPWGHSRAPLSTYAPPLPPAEIGWGRPKAGWRP